MDVLAELNPAQREAVEAISGPVLILAGPGSGKTRVITHRVAYLITVCGVNPRRIMAVTFTNKAAREMSDRLHNLVSGSAGELTLGTFHAICARILRQDGSALDINPGYVIYDAGDQQSLLKRAMLEIDIDPKQYAPSSVGTAISRAKSHLLTPADYVRQGRSYFEEIVSRCYERYQQLLTESNALDFDDLLMKAVQLFRKSPETLSRYQSRYLHLLVDEFQDTNLVQYELVRQLGAKHRNICVVGDPDQSIYSWRSADLRNILSFENDYPDAKLVILEQNYRSTRTILDTASSVISANELRKQKNLWTDNEAGELIRIVETYTEQEEAQFVVNEIERLVDLKEAKLGDCAVMYRTNAQSRVIEEAFVRYGTPYKLVAGTRFYERREVKDIIAYLRLVHNPQDTVSLMRVINVPGRGIGQQTLAQLSDRARSLGVSPSEALRLVAETIDKDDGPEHPFSPRAARLLTDFRTMLEGLIAKSRELDLVELFDTVVESSGYQRYIMSGADGEERWDNILELRGVAQEYRHLKSTEGLVAFLEGVALVSDIDSLDETTDRVTLITLHQAKGLEFPVVFIVGMEERLLPHVRSFDDPAQMEEERRLCYVGITRAKQHLYLVRSFRRTLMGSSNVNKPSRFLEDIPGHLTSTPGWWQEGTDRVAEAVYSWDQPTATAASGSTTEPDNNPAPLQLKAGDHVSHTQFGEGVVVSCREVRDDSEAVVAFIDQGVKKLLLSLAGLKKIG